jgi:hypothetical protein
VLNASYLNMADLLKYERLLFTVEALDHISRLWGDAEYTAQVKEAKATPARRTTREAAAAATTAETVADGEEVEAPVEATDAATDDTTEAKA